MNENEVKSAGMSELTEEERERLRSLNESWIEAKAALDSRVPLVESDPTEENIRTLEPLVDAQIEAWQEVRKAAHEALPALLASQEENRGLRERVAELEKVAEQFETHGSIHLKEGNIEFYQGSAGEHEAPELAAYLRGRTQDVGERG